MNFSPSHPHETVSEAATRLYPNTTFDTALPQGWVDRLFDRELDPRGHFVWLYERGMLAGRAAPVTERGVEIASLLATYVK